ncbi:MAG: alcohol dehydrogenase catalytic domain-containing protein [Chloroflexota bacterium]
MEIAKLNLDGFVVFEQERPVPAPNELLVQTIGCGVCGGDVFVYRTRETLDSAGLILGHEASGVVVEVGAEVEGFTIGDRVTALGGAYADYFVIEPDKLVKIPPNVDPLYALGEPIACCVHAGNRFGIQPGDRVAVVGCGFMGLICLQLAKIQGAAFITAIDPIPYRQSMSLDLGANEAYAPNDYRVKDPSQGEFDVVIEATGVQNALGLCGNLVKQHGRLILIGYHQSNEGMRHVNMQLWNFKAIDVINGHVRREQEKRDAMAQGLDLMSKGLLVTEPLVELYQLADVEQAFTNFIKPKEGFFKAVLQMPANNS